jgi:dolichol kinase
MSTRKHFRGLAGTTAMTLAGTLFFFVIIGVFGQEAAIAGLLLFVLTAIFIYRAVPVDGETR